MHPPEESQLIARLERFCAELYRTVPLEGHGLVGQATELAHAAVLDAEAELRESGEWLSGQPPALTARDVSAACQLLIDVRRAPNLLQPQEVALVRVHFPEVEAPSLDPLEELVGFYTALLEELE